MKNTTVKKYIIDSDDQIVGFISVPKKQTQIEIGTDFVHCLKSDKFCIAINRRTYKVSNAKKYIQRASKLKVRLNFPIFKFDHLGNKNYIWNYVRIGNN